MTDILCGYTDRDETIVAYLYNDIDPAERRVFQQHLLTCAICRDEVAAFKSVQKQLARWDPPLPASISNRDNPQSPIPHPQSSSWWRELPVWAQVAAALLFLGVSAGIANLDVHYDASGLSVRTGWSGGSGGTEIAKGPHDAPWRTDLARLEQQLKSEMRAAAPVSAAAMPSAPMIRNASSGTAASAEVLRDVNAQRQADLVKIDRNLGQMENTLGVQVLQQRQQVNYLMRANQRQ